MEKPVVIIGGGLAGLACATELHQQGVPFILFEASNAWGGRVRTDEVNGFLLDRGFQVFLTAYPDARRFLNVDDLNLKRFSSGALIRAEGKFQEFSDPWKKPSSVIKTLSASAGSFSDKLRVARFRSRLSSASIDELLLPSQRSSAETLAQLGFSERMIERFFRPFFGGVFLDSDLETSERMLRFTFRMFSEGSAAIPENGMQEIPNQLARHLPADALHLNRAIANVRQHEVITKNGETIAANAVVVATDEISASRLLDRATPTGQQRSVTCLYFGTETPPLSQPILVLNGEQNGPVNNFCVPSLVSRKYAPEGLHLCSATVLNAGEWSDEELLSEVRSQMQAWFGPSVEIWQHLKTYRIPYALPDQSPAADQSRRDRERSIPGIHICGDYLENGSINGALVSGYKAACEVMQQFTESGHVIGEEAN